MKTSRESADNIGEHLRSDEDTRANPFPGPTAYRYVDKWSFLEREDEVEELASLILSTSAVLLLGPSAAGKTSLLQAGLIPYLERRHSGVAIVPIVDLGMIVLRGGETRNTLSKMVYETIATGEEGGLFSGIDSIGALANSYRTSPGQRVLLILDRFEEIFRAPVSSAERVDFIVELVSALDKNPWLRAVLSLRSDYLADYESYFPDSLSIRYEVEMLSESRAIRVVEAAFSLSGVVLPSQDLQTLLDLLLRLPNADNGPAVRQAHVDMIQLQITCRRLCDELRRQPAPPYKPAFGRVAPFTPEESITCFIDEALQKAGARAGSSEAKIRKWLRAQLGVGGGTCKSLIVIEFTDDRRVAGLPTPIVNALVDFKLLKLEKRPGLWLIELAHDSLAAPIRASNEAWTCQRHRLQMRRALLLLLLLVVIILALLPLAWLGLQVVA